VTVGRGTHQRRPGNPFFRSFVHCLFCVINSGRCHLSLETRRTASGGQIFRHICLRLCFPICQTGCGPFPSAYLGHLLRNRSSRTLSKDVCRCRMCVGENSEESRASGRQSSFPQAEARHAYVSIMGPFQVQHHCTDIGSSFSIAHDTTSFGVSRATECRMLFSL